MGLGAGGRILRHGAGTVSVRGYVLSWDLEVEEYVAIRPDGSYIPLPRVGFDRQNRPVYQATVTYQTIENGCQATGDLRGVFIEICKFDYECVERLVREAIEAEQESLNVTESEHRGESENGESDPSQESAKTDEGSEDVGGVAAEVDTDVGPNDGKGVS